MTALQPEVAALVARQRLTEPDALRERLPLDDPDRHDIDTVDVICRRLAPTSDGSNA